MKQITFDPASSDTFMVDLMNAQNWIGFDFQGDVEIWNVVTKGEKSQTEPPAKPQVEPHAAKRVTAHGYSERPMIRNEGTKEGVKGFC